MSLLPKPCRLAGSAARNAARGLAVAGALFALGALHPSQAGESVKTRAWDHEGFGRLVFDWSAPVAHTVKTEDGQLVIAFDRPMDGALDSIADRLSPYISAARLEDDGRKAVLTLRPDVSGRDVSDGNLVIIDLVAGGVHQSQPGSSADSGTGGGDAVAVRAGEHGDYTRLVFDWRQPVEYKASQDGNEIHITFDSPKHVDVAALGANLPPLVTAASATETGHGDTVTLKVADGARFRHFRSETKVVVDVLAPVAAETASRELAPAGGPAPQAPATEKDPRETGVNPDKSRDAAPIAPEQPPHATPAPPQTPAPIAPKRMRTSVADASDAIPAETAQTAPAAAPAPAVAPPTRLYPQPAPDVAAPISAPSAGTAETPQTSSQSPAPAAVKSPLSDSAPIPSADQTPPLQPASGPAEAAAPSQLALAEIPPPAAAPKAAAPIPAAPEEQLAAVPPAAPQAPAPKAPQAVQQPAPQSVESKAAEPPQAEMRAPSAPSAAPQNAAAPAPEVPKLKVTISGNRDALALRFPWSQPTAAAAYRRAGGLWVVFDRPADFDLSVLKRGGGGMIAGADQIDAGGAAAVRIKLNPAFNPELRREGEAWIVDLRREELRPRTPVSVSPVAQAGQPSRFVVPLARAGREVTLKDPDVGDTVVVLPVLVPGQGIAATRDYPLFRLLATAQGVAIESKADGLEMRATPDGLEIIGKNGLFLTGEKIQSAQNAPETPAPAEAASSQAASQAEAAKPAPQAQPTSQTADAKAAADAASSLGHLYDFDKWALGDMSFEAAREELEHKAADTSAAARNEARMDLAKFYFARGYAAEALGLLRVTADADPSYADQPVYHAISGAAHYLMGDYAAAAQDLAAPDLAGSGEAAVWRGAVAVEQQKWPDATTAFAVAGDRIPTFPLLFRPRLALAAAESALMSNQFDAMKTFLGMAKTNDPDPADEARAKYLQGLAEQKLGHESDAAGLYDAAAAHGDQEITVRATFAKVTMLLDSHKMEPADAIKALEALRYSWRGDAFEFDLLRRLGELYLAQSDYEKGLTTLRRAVTLFPTIDGAQTVTQEMGAAFSKLYVDGAADGMEPIKSLGLYQEFRELTPTGEKGDEMIRKLAERLVDVDLLDQAADLLQQQVQFRLQGEPKARVGARLASIWLLDKTPDKALDALTASAVDSLPADLVTERRHLKARALAQLGKTDEAFNELKGDDSAAADTIRADAMWDKRDWAGAAKALSRLAAAIPADAPKLADDQSVTVLRLAVALWLANDQAGLNTVRQHFAEKMKDTPYKDDFRVIAAAPADDVQSVQAVTKRLAEVDEYAAFLKGLRDHSPTPQVANATN